MTAANLNPVIKPTSPGGRGPSNTNNNQQAVVRLDNTLAALELRRRGKSFQQISDLLDLGDRANAQALVERAMTQVVQEPATQVIELECQRLDELQSAMWDPAITNQDPKAALVILKIMERRARYLGLDKAATQTLNITRTDTPQPPTPGPEQLAYMVQLAQTLHATGAMELDLPDVIEAKAQLVSTNAQGSRPNGQ